MRFVSRRSPISSMLRIGHREKRVAESAAGFYRDAMSLAQERGMRPLLGQEQLSDQASLKRYISGAPVNAARDLRVHIGDNGRVTDEELRQAFLEHGPGWVRVQAASSGARGLPIPEQVLEGYRPFFGVDPARARVAIEPIQNPEFYRDLLARGADPRDLLNFAGGMAGITFDTAIVIAPQAELTAQLLFHELVHVVQYRILGVNRFVELYVDGWLAGAGRFRDDPFQRYLQIPLEWNAYDLQARYEQAPAAVFSVEEAVRQFLGA